MLAAATRTRSQRLCFLVLIGGCVALAVRLAVLATQPGHFIYAESAVGPGHGAAPTRDLWNVRRYCQWQGTAPANYNPLTSSREVPFADETYAVDTTCVQKLLHAENLPPPVPYALPASQSATALFQMHTATRGWNSPDPLLSDIQLYRQQVVASASRLGLSERAQRQAAVTCIISVPKWCVVSKTEYYTAADEILIESPAMSLSLLAILVGAIGSFFSRQLVALWSATAGRLVRWVKSGST